MGARFCFFTDPTLLNAQTSVEAFGPITPTTGTKDQFRVTDLHTASAAAPVFAVCGGLVCAQKDGQGTLTLILKPSHQPPFDFPAISYFLYKGVDLTSILTSDGEHIDTSIADNDLIQTIKTAWELPDNNHPTNSVPTKACLGLHLTVADYPATGPLDRLFYEGDPAIQLPLVDPGARLGTFSSSFGLEMVVERINYRPKIKLARKLETLIEVDTLASGADETAAFLHWDAKEEVLGFIDPCAFWASFFVSTLNVRHSGTSTLEPIDDVGIYADVLHGASGSFVNRNRAYLDIRNEHGCSLNYYRADGTDIHLTLDPTVDMDTAAAATVNYYLSGWPSFAIDDTFLPTGTSDVQIDVRFALPKTVNTRPLIYIAAGFKGAFDLLKDSQRFLEPPRRADSDYLEESTITIPLVDDSSGTHVASSYHKLYCFKRPLIVEDESNPPPNATDLSPTYTNDLDHFMPLLLPNQLPTHTSTMKLKMYDELFLVSPGAAGGPALVANPALAVDANNAVLMLVPRAHMTPPDRRRPVPLAFPSLAFPNGEASIITFISSLLPSPLLVREVPDPQVSSTDMELLHFRASADLTHDGLERFEPMIMIAISVSEMIQIQNTLGSPGPLFSLPVLSLTFGSSYGESEGPYTSLAMTVSTLSGQATVSRVEHPISLQLYADAS